MSKETMVRRIINDTLEVLSAGKISDKEDSDSEDSGKSFLKLKLVDKMIGAQNKEQKMYSMN